jgi:hypothetical protein
MISSKIIIEKVFMMKLLKKYLKIYGLGIIFTFNFIEAYVAKIHNFGRGTVRIIAKLALCEDKEITLKLGQNGEIDTGGICCFIKLQLIGLSGPIAGMSFEYTPRITGAGWACRDFEIRLVQSANGGIKVEESW